MKTKEENIELIERYIDGELSERDIELFEKRLKNDPDLANEYKKRVKINQLWKEANNYETTKREISDIVSSGKSSFFITDARYIVSIAASIIVLLGIYLIFFQSRNNINQNQQLVISDSTENLKNPISFQIDEPKKLAALKILNDSIELLFPVDNITFTSNNPIVFEWKSLSDKMDTLYVFNTSENRLVKKQIIQQYKDTITFEIGRLTPGIYYWHFTDTINRGAFSIINN